MQTSIQHANLKATSRPLVAASMTKDQLLAMTEQQYMNQAQLDYFRNLLEKERANLLAATSIAGRAIDDYVQESDPTDRASNEESVRAEHSNRIREGQRLSAVCLALAKIDSGEYGFCLNTGDPIGLARLLANPTASLTTEEQDRCERQNRRIAG